jgi:hypothetical protein
MKWLLCDTPVGLFLIIAVIFVPLMLGASWLIGAYSWPGDLLHLGLLGALVLTCEVVTFVIIGYGEKRLPYHEDKI